ncbi:hypothetical protein HanXRQr2_Chr09g0393431 [Helianthus annuus]|uniref:Uncharacterized protein n=1 Tax=Helianthus annuus TaxID=4232 RepID=A0A9K3I705_HELAN|nr:hypothetical protein HanXRQr2_Chr09g0393431 [Helianthus annuus]
MHNVQVLRHQETQINYPSTGSSSAVHFSQFSHGSRSQPSTTPHTDQQFLSLSFLTHLTKPSDLLSLLSLSLSRRLKKPMPDLSPDPFHEQIFEDSTAYSPPPCYAGSIAASPSFQVCLLFRNRHSLRIESFDLDFVFRALLISGNLGFCKWRFWRCRA